MLLIHTDTALSAKYIEGLENRLGRMESLLKLSGLLSAEDGHTDLGTLEKRLADKALSNQGDQRPDSGDGENRSPEHSSDDLSQSGNAAETQGQAYTSPPRQQEQNKRSSGSSTKPRKDEEVEAVAELMCSLVTNNYGETRFIGRSFHEHAGVLLNIMQALRLGSQYFPLGAFSGLMRKLAMTLSKG